MDFNVSDTLEDQGKEKAWLYTLFSYLHDFRELFKYDTLILDLYFETNIVVMFGCMKMCVIPFKISRILERFLGRYILTRVF